MELSLNLLSVLTLLGAGQALLFACVLVSIRRGNVLANRLLAALLLVISIILVWNILLHTRYLLKHPHLAQLHAPLQFTLGPLIYLYIKKTLTGGTKLSGRALLHFIPSALCFIYLLPFYFQSKGHKLAYLTSALVSYPLEWYVRTGIVLLQAAIYMFPILQTVIRSPRNVDEGAKRANNVDLYWVRIWTGIFLVIWVASVIRFVSDYSVHTNLIIPFLFSVFIYTAVYVRLRRSEPVSETAEANNLLSARRYEKSTLTPERAERYLARLSEMMESEKPYTDGELSLQKLAEMLGISAHHLSQVINERLNQNFFDFVNQYRVEEAKRQLLDTKKKHYSIMAIAADVGFNSKSAFNAAFKKHANVTPSEWRRTSGQDSAKGRNSALRRPG